MLGAAWRSLRKPASLRLFPRGLTTNPRWPGKKSTRTSLFGPPDEAQRLGNDPRWCKSTTEQTMRLTQRLQLRCRATPSGMRPFIRVRACRDVSQRLGGPAFCETRCRIDDGRDPIILNAAPPAARADRPHGHDSPDHALFSSTMFEDAYLLVLMETKTPGRS